MHTQSGVHPFGTAKSVDEDRHGRAFDIFKEQGLAAPWLLRNPVGDFGDFQDRRHPFLDAYKLIVKLKPINKFSERMIGHGCKGANKGYYETVN